MAITSKYIILSTGGDSKSFLDFALNYGTLSLSGQEIQFIGSSFVDAIFVRPGATYTLSTGSGADRIYLEGSLNDYSLSRTGATLTLTRTVNGKSEVVNLAGANSATTPDSLVFADGAVGANALYNHVSRGDAKPVPTGETSVAPTGAAAPGAALSSTIKVASLDATGETVALSRPGVKFQLVGGAGVEVVYIAEGTTVDAASLGGGTDVIYFRGNWSDYTKTVSGTRMTLTRTVGDNIESVIVSAGGSTLNDLLVFADGAVRSQVAGNAVKTNANVALVDLSGYDPATVTPGLNLSVHSVAQPDAPSWSKTGDPLAVIVNFSQPVILAAGKTVTMMALVGGQEILLTATGTSATASGVGALTFTAALSANLYDGDGITLQANSLALGTATANDFKGQSGLAVSTTFPAIQAPNIRVDTAAPEAPVLGLIGSAVKGLDAALSAGGVLSVTAENQATVQIEFRSANGTVIRSVTGTGAAQAITLSAADLAELGDGEITVSVIVVDAAGNASPEQALTFTVDGQAPGAPVVALGTGIATGATAAEVTAAGGVVLVTAEAGATVAVTFTNGPNSIVKHLAADGTAQPVVLTAEDVATLGDGEISVSVAATDAAGNVSAATPVSFMLDTVAPSAMVATADAQSGIIAISGQETGSTIEYSIDGGQTWSQSFAAKAGTNTVLVREVDAAGNASQTQELSFDLAATLPALNVGLTSDTGASASDWLTSDGGLQVSGVSGGASVEYSIDGGQSWTSAFVAVEGLNQVHVRQISGSDLSPPVLIVFTLDTTGPALPGISLSAAVENGATSAEALYSGGVVQVTAEFGTSVAVTFATTQGSIVKTVSGIGAEQAVILTADDLTILGNGVVSVSAVATDAAGNASAIAGNSFTIDTAAPGEPVLDLVGDAEKTSAEASATAGAVAVTADAGTSVRLVFSGTSGTITKLVDGTGSSVAVSLTHAEVVALGNGAVSVSATAKDSAGNVSEAASLHFNLDTGLPDALVVEGNEFTGILSITGQEPGALIEFSVDGGATWSKSFTAQPGANSVLVRQTDVAGNVSPETLEEFTLDPSITLTSLSLSLENDTGISNSDGLTNDGSLVVDGQESDTALQYSVDGGETWSEDTGGFEGVTLLAVRQFDSASGKFSAASMMSFSVDATPPAAPTVTLGAGVSDGASLDEGTSSGGIVRVSAEAGSTLVVTFTGANGVVEKTLTGTGAPKAVVLSVDDLAALGDGPVNVSAVASDAAGNASTVGNGSFVLQTEPPEAPLLQIVGSQTKSLADALSTDGVLTVTAQAGIGLRLVFTGVSGTLVKTIAAATGGEDIIALSSADLVLLGDGPILVTALALDAAGNASAPATLDFSLDAVPPVAPVLTLGIGVADGGATSAEAGAGAVLVKADTGTIVTLTFTRGSNEVVKAIAANGASQVIHLTAGDMARLGDGQIQVTAVATDVAGNQSDAAQAAFILDTAVPVAGLTLVGGGTKSAADALSADGVVLVAAENGAAIKVTFNGYSGETVTLSRVGTGTAQAVTLTQEQIASLGDGPVQVAMLVTDGAGNQSALQSLTFNLDAAAPEAPLLTLAADAAQGATANEATAAAGLFTLSAEAGAVVIVTLAGSVGSITRTIVSDGSATSIVLTGLDLQTLGDGLVSVSAVASDASGNLSTPSTSSFTLDRQAPLAPSLTLGAGVSGGATQAEALATTGVVTVRAEGGSAVTVTFAGSLGTVSKELVATGTSQAVRLTASDLTALGDGPVSVTATATDAAGNSSPVGTPAEFLLDRAAPSAPIVALGSGVSDGASASEAASQGGVAFVTAAAGLTVSVTFKNGTREVVKDIDATGAAQAVVLTENDLATLGSGTVTISAVTRDQAGNASTASTQSFTLDTVAPAAPLISLMGASAKTSAQAYAVTGVAQVTAELNAAVTVTFTNGVNSVTKTLTGTGAAQAVTLTAANLAMLGNGTVSVSAVARDAVGNDSQATNRTFTLDMASPNSPALTVVGSTEKSGSAASSSAGAVTVSAELGSAVTVTFTNGANTVTKALTGTGAPQIVTLSTTDLATLGDGSVYVTASARDTAGNVSAGGGSVQFTLDRVAPNAPALALGVGIADGASEAEALAEAGVASITADAGSLITVTFVNGSNSLVKTLVATGVSQAITLTQADLTALGNGSISISAVATDAVGNESAEASQSFLLDMTPPNPSVLALVGSSAKTTAQATGASGVLKVTTESGATATIKFTSTTGTITKTLVGTGVAQTVLLSAADATALGNGTVNVSVQVHDAVGNISTAAITAFTIDDVAPGSPVLQLGTGVADIASAAEATAATGVVTVQAEAGSAVMVTFTNGSKTVTKTLTGTGAAQAVVLSAANLATLGDGTITVSASARDAAGNVSSGSTTSFTLDSVAPVSPAIALGVGLADGATLAEARAGTGAVLVTAEAGTTVTVTFTNGSATVEKSVVATGGSDAVTLSASDLTLLGNGTISVSAVTKDAVGNASAPVTSSFMLDMVAPGSPSLVLIGSTTKSSAGASVTSGVVEVTAEQGAVVRVTFTRGSTQIVKTLTATGGTQSVSLTAADVAALGDGAVAITAVATDPAGNNSSIGSGVQFTLDRAAPGVPTIALGTGVADIASAAEATAASGVITVTAEAGSTVSVVFSNGSNSVVKSLTATGAAQAVVLTTADLQALGDGTIAVTAQAKDTAGNESAEAASSFALDRTPPATPTMALSAGIAGGVTAAEALASTGVVNVTAETGAQVTVVFTAGANTVTKTFTGNGLTQTVSLTANDLVKLGNSAVSVSSYVTDSVGNQSAAATASFTIDTVAPTSPTLALAGAAAKNAVGAVGTVANVTGETGAQITVTFVQGSVQVTKTVVGTGTAQAVALTASDVAMFADGVISINAVAQDAAGNASGISSTAQFTLDRAAPAVPVLARGAGVADGASSTEATAAGGVVTVAVESGMTIQVVFIGINGSVTKTLTADGTAKAVVLTASDLTALGNGQVLVSAQATDAAGNVTVGDPLTFQLDTVAPTAPVIGLPAGLAGGASSPEALNENGILTVTAEAGAVTVVTFVGTLATDTRTVIGTGAPQAITLDASQLTTLGNGNVNVTAVATDAVGNVSATSATSSFLLDTVNPTVSLTAGNGANTSSATVQSSELGTVYLVNTAYIPSVTTLSDITSRDGKYWNSVNVTTASSNTSLSLLGLASGTYKAYAVDAAGNISAVSSNTYTVNAVIEESALLNASNSMGFVFYGSTNAEFLGMAISYLGDVNGDSYGDIAIGPIATDNRPSRTYVVFGGPANLGGAVSASLYTVATNTLGFYIDASSIGDYPGNALSSAGDVNGDGINDLILGGYGVNDADGSTAGSAYIVYGKTGSANVNLSSFSTAGSAGFQIFGESGQRGAGFAVSSAGDFNGDGYGDLLISAPLANGGANTNGRVYVVYGASSNSNFNLSALSVASNTQGFIIDGSSAGDTLGFSVSDAGDVNGDGLTDLMMSARGADMSGSDNGAVYVLFGRTGNSGAPFNPSALTAASNTQGFVIVGSSAGDNMGDTVVGGGDVNGDGLSDMIVAARFADGAGTNVGKAYVVFGKTGGTAVNLSAFTVAGNTQGFVINGSSADDKIWGVTVIGDINGDGLADLLVGAENSDANGYSNSGKAYVVFGKTDGGGVDLSALSAAGNTQGFAIHGSQADALLGRTVAAGDLSGDGLADLMISAPVDGTTYGAAGAIAVIYGSTTGVFSSTKVSQMGTSGADTLIGTAGTDSLIGAAGNDVLRGNGGVDVLYGGAGNDRIIINADNVAKLGQSGSSIQGGLGLDTLALEGGGITLDLTTLRDAFVKGVEKIDLTGTGNNTLKLGLTDVLNLHDPEESAFNLFSSLTGKVGKQQIMIDGDAGDALQLVGTGKWVDSGIDVQDGATSYSVYNYNGAAVQLLIDNAVTTSVIAA